MIGKHPQADRILVAKISGEAEHHAKRRELTADEEAAAVAALRGLAGGRADLPLNDHQPHVDDAADCYFPSIAGATWSSAAD